MSATVLRQRIALVGILSLAVLATRCDSGKARNDTPTEESPLAAQVSEIALKMCKSDFAWIRFEDANGVLEGTGRDLLSVGAGSSELEPRDPLQLRDFTVVNVSYATLSPAWTANGFELVADVQISALARRGAGNPVEWGPWSDYRRNFSVARQNGQWSRARETDYFPQVPDDSAKRKELADGTEFLDYSHLLCLTGYY